MTGAAERLTALANKFAKSPWPFGPSPRGFAIEARLGGNLPASFPTIDRFNDTTGVATSIKSIDLASKTYQNPARLEALVTRYIDKTGDFYGADWGGKLIREFDITSRQLLVAITRNASPEHLAVFARMDEYASSKGVELIVEVVR